MRTKLFQAFVALGVLGGTSVYFAPTEALAQSGATVGSLRGQLKEKSGEPAIGATVVATSPALVGEQVVITDEKGLYFISSLPPGLYTLTIYYQNQPFSRPNVLIQLGKEAVVNVTVDPTAAKGGGPKGEVIEIKGTVPIIDQGSTKTGFTITDDYTRNIPTGRTFGGALGAVAGSQTDQFGVSLAGATSAENVYVIEGINTTDTGFGGISTNLPNEFIQETEIITGGYNAEFGRATGGIINVITKSGSDQFRGSVFGYFTPGALVSNAKKIQREGSAIDTESNLDLAYDVGAEFGGPIIPKKLWFHVGINPSSNKLTTTRSIQQQVDIDQDGIPDVDPATGLTIHRPIGASDGIQQNLTTYFFTAKINGAVDQNNQFQVSVFGNPRSGTANVSNENMIRNPNNTQFRLEDGAYDLAGKWTSKFKEGKTQVDAVVGFHRGYENQKVLNSEQNKSATEFNFERSLFDFQDIERGNIAACQDGVGTDEFMNITNCPVTGYRSQGLGGLEERTNDRASFVAAVTHRVKAAGYHTFKGGIDFEQSTYNAVLRTTGGQFLQRGADPIDPINGMPRPGRWLLREHVQIIHNLSDAEKMDPNFEANLPAGQILCVGGAAVCAPIDAARADTKSRGLAAFIQDSWQVRPNLTFNAGVRWENQTGYVGKAAQGQISPTGEIIPDKAFELKNLIAPRLGFIYDPTQEGKSKIYGHFGQFYEAVPLRLQVRQFGGDLEAFTNVNQFRLQPGETNAGGITYDPNCDVNYTPGTDLAGVLQQCPTNQRLNRFVLGEGVTFVPKNLRGQYTQEFILGGEYELIADLKIGLSYTHRSMPQVIEDVSPDGGSSYLITNPGGDFSKDARDLRAESGRLLMESGCVDFNEAPSATCDGTKQSLAILQDSRAQQLDDGKKFDKPVRNYDAVTLTVVQRPTKRSLVQASYTYSVSKGNYPGLFSTETGQTDPNILSLYDLPDLLANRYGNMGLDRPHNVKIDGFYQFDLKKAGLITTGLSFRAVSGIAHNALAAHPIYGEDESYLVPRGSLARSPVTFQSDIHLSYGRRLNKTTTAEGFIRVFNVLNAQEELDADERYTLDSAIPVVGGDREDLKHVKAIDGGTGSELNQTPFVNTNFGKLDTRQAPRQIQVGFRVTF